MAPYPLSVAIFLYEEISFRYDRLLKLHIPLNNTSFSRLKMSGALRLVSVFFLSFLINIKEFLFLQASDQKLTF